MPRFTAKLSGSARRDQRIIAAATVVLCLLLLGFFGYALRGSYNDRLEVARVRSANLARLLDEQTRSTMQVVDLSLVSLAEYLRRHPDTPPHDPQFTDLMAAELQNMPYVRALFIVGPDGFIIQDTDEGTPRVSLADRDYFRQAQENRTGELYVGQPLTSRSTQIGSPWFLSLSRPIRLPDGRFHGVAVAAVEPRYFASFYDDLRPEPEASIALMHRNSSVVARFPLRDDTIGRRFDHLEPFSSMLGASPVGAFELPSPLDGVVRLYSYRVVDPYPLVVLLGVSRNALTAAWWRDRRTEIIAAALAIAALIGAGFAFIQARGREALQDAHVYRLEKSNLIAQMTGSIAHDFNNLLAVVQGNLDLLHRKLPEGDRRREYAARALAAVQRGTALASQILSYSREAPAEMTIVNLNTLIADMDWMIRHAAAPAAVEFRYADGLWPCAMDRSEFERALINLVGNARDAMPNGGSVTIETFNLSAPSLNRNEWPDVTPADYVACEVRDEGQGMPPEVAAEACKPYFTTKPAGRGTGLGLSQVAAFAHQCGGHLRIDSTVGVGTTVTLLIPRAQAEVAATDPAPTPTRQR